MFALPHEEYPGLERVKKDIKLASLLFDLYVDVIRSINEWKLVSEQSVNILLHMSHFEMNNQLTFRTSHFTLCSYLFFFT